MSEKVKLEEAMPFVNALRALSLDMIDKANSGHPGLPLGAAPMAYVLWKRHLKINPANPGWADRDRFVLSAGHGSALLYSLLYLSGYELSMDDLKAFRQPGSKTPGHPESHATPGVEATTGPLGQGSANAVGMAIAERSLAARFNQPGHDVVDHHTYALVSDGDIMEGVCAEACSLAGHLKLGKLIFLYDANDITLDGPASLSFSEDVAKRFLSYGWQVLKVEDGNNGLVEIDRAISRAKKETSKPSIIIIKTIIGCGSQAKQGTCKAHGSPLGAAETAETKKVYGRDPEKLFHITDAEREHFLETAASGKRRELKWRKAMEKYAADHPALVREFNRAISGGLPDGWEDALPAFAAGEEIATRVSSGKALNAAASVLPELFGGDADLSESTKTAITGGGDFDGATGAGRNIHFGVREHAMAAIANGICMHGGARPYVSTFFVFSDYMKPSVRIAAMCGLSPIYVFTHDSIAVGEDGPTHQPVEHLMALRLIPNMKVIRPCDANESSEAWKAAIGNQSGPTALVLSRQNLPVLDRNVYASAEGLRHGAYVLTDAPSGAPDCIIIATGSEVHIALEAKKKLEASGIAARVVSMPCMELFAAQSEEYRESVLPSAVTKRVSIEAGATSGWEKYACVNIGIDRFGASGPASAILDQYGMSAETVVDAVNKLS